MGVEAPGPNVDSGSTGTPDAADSGPRGTADAAGATPDATACSLPDVAGHWTGLFTATTGFLSGGTSQADLKQSCTVITGSLVVDGCLESIGQLVATFDEDGGLAGDVLAGEMVMTLTGTLPNPNKIQGTFSTDGKTLTFCSKTSGTFQLYRQ